MRDDIRGDIEDMVCFTVSEIRQRNVWAERRLVAGFTICAAFMVGSELYSLWQTRKTAQIADKNHEMVIGLTDAFGNTISVGDRFYTIHEELPQGKPCHVMNVYR
jgi:hypothetical protein